MGVTYSKQIDSAFDQIGPFLQATKQISLSLAVFYVVTTLILGFMLCVVMLALLALLVTVNPDLEAERRAMVTPVVRRMARWTFRPVRDTGGSAGGSEGVGTARRGGRTLGTEKSE
jgi:hypothetical protein